MTTFSEVILPRVTQVVGISKIQTRPASISLSLSRAQSRGHGCREGQGTGAWPVRPSGLKVGNWQEDGSVALLITAVWLGLFLSPSPQNSILLETLK